MPTMTAQRLYRLRLAEKIEAGQTTPMMVFPIGDWHSAKYPDLALSEDLAHELIANFESGVLGREPILSCFFWGKRLNSYPRSSSAVWSKI